MKIHATQPFKNPVLDNNGKPKKRSRLLAIGQHDNGEMYIDYECWEGTYWYWTMQKSEPMKCTTYGAPLTGRYRKLPQEASA